MAGIAVSSACLVRRRASLASRPVGLQQATQIDHFNTPTSLVCGLNGELACIRSKADLHGISSGGQAQGVGFAIEAIFNQDQPVVAALGNDGQITAVPAQGRRAMGLMAREVA